MPVNFSDVVYLPCFDTFARVISVAPIVSQPAQAAYATRGIFDTRDIDVVALDGSIISEQRTILDVRDSELAVVPVQGDQITIPADGGLPDAGLWEVIDSARNGGGETTLTLRKIMPASKPALKLVKAK
jgi:hypothetical protein